MSVFGLVWGSTGGGGNPPSPFDVRVGVDNGAGSLGTLTSPSQGVVLSGIQYGGGGTQYTGSLVIPGTVPKPIDTWTQDMADVFSDSLVEWGDFLSYGGNRIPCQKTNLTIEYEMQVSGANRLVDTSIDVLRSDAISIGLYTPDIQDNPTTKRPIVTVDGMKFQVIQFKDDIVSDPTIKMMCVRIQ